MKQKKVLIAGGAGFIGSHLCRNYLEKNWRVVCLDSLLTGRMENIEGFFTNQLFSFIQQDIIHPVDTWKLQDTFDLVLNFACAASPPNYQKDPVHTFKTCVWGTEHLLQVAQKNGARFVQASTSEVYGDPKEHPQKETYWGHVNPIGVRSCYDEGKRAAETLCVDMGRQFNIDVGIIRIFNTYGPNMDPKDGRVVSNFMVQALNNEPLTLYGSGEQTRSFCYVDDLVDGILRFSEMKNMAGPINLGNDQEFTVKELAQLVIEITGSKSDLKYLALPSDDPKTRRPDLSYAKAILKGWEPKTTLRKGIEQSLSYFRG